MDKETVKEEMEEKVRDWFESSGKMKEIQAKLRSELFEIIQSQLKTKQDLPLKATANPKPTPPLTKLVNWLVSEHLAQNQNWLTNSVFVTEAEIEETISAPTVMISSQVGSRLKEYETEVVSGDTVSHILGLLGFKNNPELLKTVLKCHHKKSQSVLCSLISGMAMEDYNGARNGEDTEHQRGRRKQEEKSIPAHLQSIDRKYDDILQDFSNKRKEEMKPISQTCLNCDNMEQLNQRKFKQRAAERNRARCQMMDYDVDPFSDSSAIVDKRLSRTGRAEGKRKDKSIEEKSRKDEEEKYGKLYDKINEFLVVQEKDKGLVMDLNTSLMKAESEIVNLKQQLQEKDYNSEREKEEEHLLKLTNIVKKQNEKIDEQNKEMTKLRNMDEINKLREKTTPLPKTFQEKTQARSGKSNENKSVAISPSPTDFLANMKAKLDGLIKEDSTINDEFEELHYETSQKE